MWIIRRGNIYTYTLHRRLGEKKRIRCSRRTPVHVQVSNKSTIAPALARPHSSRNTASTFNAQPLASTLPCSFPENTFYHPLPSISILSPMVHHSHHFLASSLVHSYNRPPPTQRTPYQLHNILSRPTSRGPSPVLLGLRSQQSPLSPLHTMFEIRSCVPSMILKTKGQI